MWCTYHSVAAKAMASMAQKPYTIISCLVDSFMVLPFIVVVVSALHCQDTFHQDSGHWWTYCVSEASHLLSAGAHGFEAAWESHNSLGFVGLEHSHPIPIDYSPDILSYYRATWAVQ